MYNIAVIGCGIIGLTTAVEIQRKFGKIVKVTIYADKFSPNTTSDIAAGLWEPYLLADNSEQDVARWSKETFDYLLRLWQEGKSNEAGICLQPVINLFNCKNYSVPKWVSISLGYNELNDRHLQSLSEQYNQRLTSGFMFVGFTWEPAIFLPYFQQEFLRRNGTIIERHIEQLDELDGFDMIVNCTGFGARTLANDDKVIPIRGQVKRVEAPWQYMIYLVQCDDDEDCCYIIPNRDSVILGGTKQQSFDTTVSSDDSKLIIRNISKICPPAGDAKVLKEVVGLRPSRFKVRLDEEVMKTRGGKMVNVVHNYGHGGAGITLCIGCAKDAVKIIEDIFKRSHSKL